jgi:hypothetical protein
MIPSELIEQLKAHIPPDLAADLVTSYLQIRHDVATQTLERSAPGKFVETVVQILQYLETGKYDKGPKVDEYLKNLESRATSLPDDLKIAVSRVARASYTLRNKRSIAHKGEVNPNVYDLRYLYSASQWILSEIVRQILSTDMSTAGRLIDFIQVPASFVVEDFGDKKLVLIVGTTEEELLTLLFHYFPLYVQVSQIHKDMDRRAKSTVSNSIASTYRKRLIEGNKHKGYKLTTLGYRKAFELIKEGIEAQS